MQCRTNVVDVGLTLYKCYTNVLCLLGQEHFLSNIVHLFNVGSMLGQRRSCGRFEYPKVGVPSLFEIYTVIHLDQSPVRLKDVSNINYFQNTRRGCFRPLWKCCAGLRVIKSEMLL